MDVSGKKAIIFGGTSGIGLAAAKQLADLGAEVIAISRDPSKAGDVPDGVTLRKCDALDRDAVQALFEELAPFDILISAAVYSALDQRFTMRRMPDEDVKGKSRPIVTYAVERFSE